MSPDPPSSLPPHTHTLLMYGSQWGSLVAPHPHILNARESMGEVLQVHGVDLYQNQVELDTCNTVSKETPVVLVRLEMLSELMLNNISSKYMSPATAFTHTICDHEATVQRTFCLERSSFFYLSTLMARNSNLHSAALSADPNSCPSKVKPHLMETAYP